MPAWAVYVEGDWFSWVVGFEEEELGYYGGGGCFVYGAGEEDDAFAEEAGEYVVCWVWVSFYPKAERVWGKRGVEDELWVYGLWDMGFG